MGLSDLVEGDGGDEHRRGSSSDEDDEEKSMEPKDVAKRVKSNHFLDEYDEEGEHVGRTPEGRGVPDDRDPKWLNLTNEVEIGRVGGSGNKVHVVDCVCGNECIFWMRRAWTRCAECNKVIINTDWEEDWWKHKANIDEQKDGDEDDGHQNNFTLSDYM